MPGEVLALVGESGSGKTTLVRAIQGLQRPTSGTIRLEGETQTIFHDPSVQMVFQDPTGALNPRQTIYEIVAEGLRIRKDRGNELEMVCRALSRAGLRPPERFLSLYPHEISGGQRQRVVIAGAMVMEPRLLLADEPVASLDASIRGEILALMRGLVEDTGLAILAVTHDLGLAWNIADRVAVMYLGRIVETGPTEEILDQPQHPYTRALLSVVPETREMEQQILKGEIPDLDQDARRVAGSTPAAPCCSRAPSPRRWRLAASPRTQARSPSMPSRLRHAGRCWPCPAGKRSPRPGHLTSGRRPVPTGGVVSLTSDDEQSFEDLFRTHHQAIYRYCLRRLEASDAEDAAAEVFAVAWRRRGAIPEGDASRVWLYGVAFRVVGNRYRSSRRRARLTARVQSSMRSSVQFDDVSDGELLLAALSRLNASDREILKLSTWDDLDRARDRSRARDQRERNRPASSPSQVASACGAGTCLRRPERDPSEGGVGMIDLMKSLDPAVGHEVDAERLRASWTSGWASPPPCDTRVDPGPGPGWWQVPPSSSWSWWGFRRCCVGTAAPLRSRSPAATSRGGNRPGAGE